MREEKTLCKHRKVLDTVDVRPGKLEKLNLGVFDKGHEPPVIVELEPEMSEYVKAIPVPLLLPGDRVELRYHIQNFGSVKCRVTLLTEG